MLEVLRPVSSWEAAMLVGVSEEKLLGEAVAGRLQPSYSVESLVAWKALLNEKLPAEQELAAAETENGSATLVLGPFTGIAPFTHTWPDNTVETYVRAYQAIVSVNSRTRIIIVAFTERASTGMDDRARAIVFYQAPPKQRALVEFSGNGNLQTATQYACPIKPRGSHSHLRPGNPIPNEYANMPLGVFSSVVQGPYAAHSTAVVVDTADQDTMLEIMARHGIIRGVFKGWL